MCFARFCDTFGDVLARVGRCGRANDKDGLAFVVSHPCLKNKGTARMGHPARGKEEDGLAFVVSHPCLRNKGTARMGHPAVETIFRMLSCMVFALRRITSIVRFWGLIACKVGQLILAGLVVCFVGFGGWRGNWGA